MLIFRIFDKEKNTDRVWYNSSNIVYTECVDNKDAFKTLRVTFKNGSTYEYKDVDVNDYVAFVHGGLDGSNGKALNKIIKKNYEFKKLDNKNIEELLNEMEELKNKENLIENEHTKE